MKKVRQISFFLLLCIYFSSFCIAQDGRLESEYKLDIPIGQYEDLWQFIKTNFAKNKFDIDGLLLNGTVSIEKFIDTYYDDEFGSFAENEISLRYRKRFKDKVLLKQLIQLKTPYSEDKIIRNEIKFAIDDNKNVTDISNRHSFLKYLKNSDIDRMAEHLAEYKLRPEQVIQSLKLKQTRSRVYIKNNEGESIATITLDKVTNATFPFQQFSELELELNEVRFTDADAKERSQMTALNENLKKQLLSEFPELKVDQRSKYRKMKLLIDNSWASLIWKNISWLFFSIIIVIALIYFIKDLLI